MLTYRNKTFDSVEELCEYYNINYTDVKVTANQMNCSEFTVVKKVIRQNLLSVVEYNDRLFYSLNEFFEYLRVDKERFKEVLLKTDLPLAQTIQLLENKKPINDPNLIVDGFYVGCYSWLPFPGSSPQLYYAKLRMIAWSLNQSFLETYKQFTNYVNLIFPVKYNECLYITSDALQHQLKYNDSSYHRQVAESNQDILELIETELKNH